MNLFNRKIEPRNDPRHVPEETHGAVLLAMLMVDSVDGDIGHSNALIPMGGWMDEDQEAFRACLTDAMNHATRTDLFTGDEFLIEYASEILG